MLKARKRITKKEIKHDPFLESIYQTKEYFEKNVKTITRAGIGLIAVLIVTDLSFAEIPVVTPFRASIDTVKAVWLRDLLTGDINDKLSFVACLFVKDKQIKPRPYLAIKLIFFCETFDAGITKSPSFSLFSSSTRMYIFPFLATLIMFSIGLNLLFFI